MISYVVGFAFSKDRESILLIKKLKPEWQRGFLNGIGGKIEDGELPLDAMNRECMEEAGLILEWTHRGVMKWEGEDDGSNSECHIFFAYDDRITEFKQLEDEELAIYEVNKLNDEKIISNLHFLIPFGKYENNIKFMQLEF